MGKGKYIAILSVLGGNIAPYNIENQGYFPKRMALQDNHCLWSRYGISFIHHLIEVAIFLQKINPCIERNGGNEFSPLELGVGFPAIDIDIAKEDRVIEHIFHPKGRALEAYFPRGNPIGRTIAIEQGTVAYDFKLVSPYSITHHIVQPHILLRESQQVMLIGLVIDIRLHLC